MRRFNRWSGRPRPEVTQDNAKRAGCAASRPSITRRFSAPVEPCSAHRLEISRAERREMRAVGELDDEILAGLITGDAVLVDDEEGVARKAAPGRREQHRAMRR